MVKRILPFGMVTRILLIVAIIGVAVTGVAGCSSANHPGSLAPTPSPTPPAPRVGDAAPDFALDTLDGTRKVHLSDFRGKAVLLFFWAITCSSCVKELPVIQKFYAQQQAAGRDFVVLAVDIDDVDNFVKVARLQQDLGLTYPIIVDDHFLARSSYQVSNVPICYFLDHQSIIRSIVAGPLDDTTLRKQASQVEA